MTDRTKDAIMGLIDSLLTDSMEESTRPLTPPARDAMLSEEAWKRTAEHAQRSADYYRELIVRIGEMFGREALTADDGTVGDSVLCAKVPGLVLKRLQAGERLYDSVEGLVRTATDRCGPRETALRAAARAYKENN